MLRTALEEALLFAAPFALFGVYLVLLRRDPRLWAHWSPRALWLTLAGLLLVAGSFVAAGLLAPRERDGFVPSHMENGRLVPGTFRHEPR